MTLKAWQRCTDYQDYYINYNLASDCQFLACLFPSGKNGNIWIGLTVIRLVGCLRMHYETMGLFGTRICNIFSLNIWTARWIIKMTYDSVFQPNESNITHIDDINDYVTKFSWFFYNRNVIFMFVRDNVLSIMRPRVTSEEKWAWYN